VYLQACEVINEDRLKVYSLLGGQLVLSSDCLTVNTCEGLDWKRNIALHLWYPLFIIFIMYLMICDKSKHNIYKSSKKF